MGATESVISNDMNTTLSNDVQNIKNRLFNTSQSKTKHDQVREPWDWGKLVDAIESGSESVSSGVSSGVQVVSNTVTDTANTIGGSLTDAANTVGGSLTNIVDSSGNFISETTATAIEGVVKAGDLTIDQITAIVDFIKEFGLDEYKKLQETVISNVANWVYGDDSSAKNTAINLLKKIIIDGDTKAGEPSDNPIVTNPPVVQEQKMDCSLLENVLVRGIGLIRSKGPDNSPICLGTPVYLDNIFAESEMSLVNDATKEADEWLLVPVNPYYNCVNKVDINTGAYKECTPIDFLVDVFPELDPAKKCISSTMFTNKLQCEVNCSSKTNLNAMRRQRKVEHNFFIVTTVIVCICILLYIYYSIKKS